MKTEHDVEYDMENVEYHNPYIKNKKPKKGTGFYMLLTTFFAGLLLFIVSKIFGTDGAIITGILMLIAMTSAIRFNI